MKHILTLSFCLVLFGMQAQPVYDRIHTLLDSAIYMLGTADRSDLSIQYSYAALDALPNIEKDSSRTLESIYFQLVNAFSSLKRNEEVVKYQLKLINHRKNDSSRHFHTQQFMNYHRLAGNYMALSNEDSSYKYLQKGIEVIFRTTDSLHMSGALNNLGIFHHRRGEMQLADSLYQVALSLLSMQTQNDSMLYASIRDNQAEIILGGLLPVASVDNPAMINASAEQIKMAISIVTENHHILKTLFERGSSKQQKTSVGSRVVNVGLKLIRLHNQIGARDEAMAILASLPQFLVTKNTENRFRQELAIEDLWIASAKDLGDYRSLSQHLSKKDSLNHAFQQHSQKRQNAVEEALTAYAVGQVEADLRERTNQLERKKVETDAQRNLLIMITSFSLLIILLLYLFYRRKAAFETIQRQLQDTELENQNLLNDKLQRDLELKEKDFSTFLMQTSLKENWARQVLTQLSEVTNNGTVDAEKLRQIMLDLRHQTSIHDKIELYQNGLDEVNERFFETLSTKFPKLTKTEKEVCALVRLNLAAKEIASIRNIDPLSVRKTRQRIRKKLGLNPEEDLYETLKSL